MQKIEIWLNDDGDNGDFAFSINYH